MTDGRYLLRALAAGVFLFAAVAGCNDKAADGKTNKDQVGEQAKPVQSPADVIVAAVDDDLLRLSDVEAEIGLQISLARMRNKNITARNLDQIATRYRNSVPGAFVRERLLREYAREAGLQLSTDEIRQYEQKMARTFRKPTFESLKTSLSAEQQTLLTNGVVRLLTMQAAMRDIVKKASVEVPDEDVTKAIERFARKNEIASQTNALAWAQASNVWHRIKSGDMTFAEAAADFSQEDGEGVSGGIWGEFDSMKLAESEPNLVSRLASMKQGDFTEPMECDNGVCIVRIDKQSPWSQKDDADGESDAAGQNTVASARMNLALSRIFFKLAVLWEIPSRDEMRKIIREANQDNAVKKKIEELGRRHVIKGPGIASQTQHKGG